MVERINLLITSYGFGFQSWTDRYGKGIWACIAPNEFLLDEMKEYSSDGDIDMINASDYIEQTNWLPFVTGNSFVEALNELERLLASLPPGMLCRGSMWSNSIHRALENLQKMRRSNVFDLYDPLPETFNDLISNPII